MGTNDWLDDDFFKDLPGFSDEPREPAIPKAEEAPPGMDLLLSLWDDIGAIVSFDELLARLLDEIVALTKAERGFFILFGRQNALEVRVARGRFQTSIDLSQVKLSQSTLTKVATTLEPLISTDISGDENLSTQASIVDLNLRMVMCVPMLSASHKVGLIYVDSRMTTKEFTPGDLDRFVALAGQAAVAVDNVRLYAELHTSVDRLVTDRYRVAGICETAAEIGGDFYELGEIRRGDRRYLALAVGDVSGHGIASGMLAAVSKVYLRREIEKSLYPRIVLPALNQLIYHVARENLLVSLFYTLIDVETGEMWYSNAGQNFPYVHVGNGSEFSPIELGAFPLGLGRGTSYVERSMALPRGSTLVIYTDGVIEAETAAGESYGYERFKSRITRDLQLDPEGAMVALAEDVKRFRGSAGELDDDLTVVVFKR
ncbi:MAG: SpoIIE family protein phosphatase [Candidatus Schekmanbacteria bacterium]|nr:SpoIIE family protein phosphatase [Candidatus Schekmanbacteria bacterium]